MIRFQVSVHEFDKNRIFGLLIKLTTAMRLSFYSKLLIQLLTIERTSIGRVFKNMPFEIITHFVGRLSTRVNLGNFGRIIRRSGMQARSCNQYSHLLGYVQLCSGVLPAGCQPPYIMM